MFCDIWYFRHISPSRIARLFSACTERRATEGEVIIKAGEESDNFYMIERGSVEIRITPTSAAGGNSSQQPSDCMTTGANASGAADASSLGPVRRLFKGDCFGENALLRAHVRSKRSSDAVALTNCRLLVLHAYDFQSIIEDELLVFKELSPPLESDVTRIAKYRPFLRDSLFRSFLFRQLKLDQIEAVAAIIEQERTYQKDELIFEQGADHTSLFLIKEGTVRFLKRDPIIPTAAPVEFLRLGEGECFGEISLITGLPRIATAIACEANTVLLELKRDAFMAILSKFPNIRFHILDLVSERLKETQQVDKQVHERIVYTQSIGDERH